MRKPKSTLDQQIRKYQKDKHLPNTYGNMKCVVQKIIIHTETRRYYEDGKKIKFDLELGEASNSNTIAETGLWRRRRRRSLAKQKAAKAKKKKAKKKEQKLKDAIPDCIKLCVVGKNHKPVSKGKNRGRRLLGRGKVIITRRRRNKKTDRPTVPKVPEHGQYCIQVIPSWEIHMSKTEGGVQKERRFVF